MMKKIMLAAMMFVMLAAMCAGAYAQGMATAAPAGTAAPMLAPGEYAVASPYGTLSVVLRDQPSNSYNALAMLPVGQAVTVLGVEGVFYQVRLADGTLGYLAAGEVK